MACRWSQLVWRAHAVDCPSPPLPSSLPPHRSPLHPSPPHRSHRATHPAQSNHHRGLNSIIKNDHQRAHCKQICSGWRLAHRVRFFFFFFAAMCCGSAPVLPPPPLHHPTLASIPSGQLNTTTGRLFDVTALGRLSGGC